MTTQAKSSTFPTALLSGVRAVAVGAFIGLSVASPPVLADTGCHHTFPDGSRLVANQGPYIWYGARLPTDSVDPHDDDGGYTTEISAWRATTSTVFDVHIDGEPFVYEVDDDGTVLRADDALAFLGDEQLPVEPLVKMLEALSSMACRPQFIAPDIFDVFINELSP